MDEPSEAGHRWHFASDPDPMEFHFSNGKAKAKGVLKLYRDGRFTFEGNADESAKAFFDAVGRQHLALVTAHSEAQVEAAAKAIRREEHRKCCTALSEHELTVARASLRAAAEAQGKE